VGLNGRERTVEQKEIISRVILRQGMDATMMQANETLKPYSIEIGPKEFQDLWRKHHLVAWEARWNLANKVETEYSKAVEREKVARSNRPNQAELEKIVDGLGLSHTYSDFKRAVYASGLHLPDRNWWKHVKKRWKVSLKKPRNEEGYSDE